MIDIFVFIISMESKVLYEFMEGLKVNLMKSMRIYIKCEIELSMLMRWDFVMVNSWIIDITFINMFCDILNLKRHPRLRDMEKAKGVAVLI